jgi:hypothetical protein
MLYFSVILCKGQCFIYYILLYIIVNDVNIPYVFPIRPKHVGKTYGVFISLTNCVDGEYNK